MIETSRKALPVVLVAGLAVLTLVVLHRLLADVRTVDVRGALAALPGWRIAGALALTAASYAALTGYDAMALRTIGRPLPWTTTALASFAGTAIAYNLGLAILTGGSARLRVYGRAGLSAPEVARVTLLTSLTFWLGIIATFGAAMLAAPVLPRLPGVAAAATIETMLGVAALAVTGLWLVLCARGRPVGWRGATLPLPTLAQGAAQLLLGAIDIAAAGGALWLLVPDAPAYGTFLVIYLAATIAGVVANTPGGIGVFEATMLLGGGADRAALFGGLIAFRLVYYLLPLLLAMLALIADALRGRGLRRRLPAGLRRLAPIALGGLVFAGGLVLLFSGALPALQGRMRLLHGLLPLPFIEASHLAASLTGTALLFLAGGLVRRADGAFVATRMLLAAGMAFSLLKGFDWEEALVLGVILVLLQASRGAFDRKSALTAGSIAPGWIAAALVALAASVWVGLFAYKAVDYDNSLWWQFATHGDASRFLRASLTVGVAAGGFALWRLLGPPRRVPDVPVPAGTVARCLAGATRTDACLALTGDKRFLVHPSGDAMIAWGIQGASWVAMSDPVGPESRWADLAWRFRAAAHAAQGRAVFYQISLAMLPAVLDLGFQVVKLGEEARVDLAAFTLAGGAMRTLRQADARLLRDGAETVIVPAGQVPALLPELQAVSDQWLVAKGHAEKHFSVGRFDPAYLARTDLAVVRLDGRIVAFANLWATADRSELSVDLMRHADDAPAGVMDHLFAQLMLRGQAAGYRWFALGMAPLAGLEARPLAPLWTRAGALLFRRGSDLYGFEGLRAYKAKFRPVWTPRYLACPRGLALATALVDVTTLISSERRSSAARMAAGDLPPAPATGLASS